MTNLNVQNILVRTPNWIGDQILAYPFFYFLRKSFPNASITVACPPWVESLQFRNLVDEVFVLPPSKSNFEKLLSLETAAKQLRTRTNFDLAIILPNSFSAAWFTFRVGAKLRRGHRADARSFLLNDGLPLNIGRVHRSDVYLQLLPKIAQPTVGLSAVVLPNNSADNSALSALKEECLQNFDPEKAWPVPNIETTETNNAYPILPPEGEYWVLAPGSVGKSRRWPVEKFIELAKLIAKDRGWQGIVVGGAAEHSTAAELCAIPATKLLNWTGKGRVSSYWKIFQKAKLTITNDSGLAHVAALCGSPVHIIWGAGNPHITAPMGSGRVTMTVNPVSCWPCEKNACQRLDSPLECLQGIYSTVVWKEIQDGHGA